MWPGKRAVITAVVAAVVLLAASFAVTATFRVAQEVRAGVLHANLAQRGRAPTPVSTGPQTIPIIAVPQRAPAKPEYVEALEPLPVVPVVAAAPLAEPVPVTPVIAIALLAEPLPARPVIATAPLSELPAAAPPPASVPTPMPRPRVEPPMGGPLPERLAAIHAEAPARDIAAERSVRKAFVKKLRGSRFARERRAARRAAWLRTREGETSVIPKLFANPFGWSFGSNTFGDSAGQRY